MPRLLCWNVCSGLTEDHVAYLAAQSHADVLVLTEYCRQNPGDLPSPSLATPWRHQLAPAADMMSRGVLIATRDELQPLPACDLLGLNTVTEELRPYIAIARLAALDLTIVGVYLPYAEGPAKAALWDALNRYAAAHRSERFVIIGDMNSGTAAEGESGYAYSPEPLQVMQGQTLDAWMQATAGKSRPDRDRYTWYTSRDERTFGRRLDYAFLSPALESTLIDARHDHTVREQGLSDHSALEVDLASTPAA